MDKIVSHKGYWCKVVQEGWKVRQWSAPETGQQETLIYPRKIYVPLDDIDNPDTRVVEVDQSGTVLDEERKERERKAAQARERSKAKTKCRHRIKSYDLRQMLTGTYKENMVDFNRARKDFAAWLRLMRKHIAGFRCVYAFEPQERGAWHWHCAIDKLPPAIQVGGHPVRSYDFVRRMWLRVTGTYEGKPNGTVNVDGHAKTKVGTPAKWNEKQSLAQIAAYVSKYLTKEHGEGLAGRNMWGSTQGMDQNKPVTLEFPDPNATFLDVIRLTLATGIPEGHRIVSNRIGRFRDFWMLYTEPV